MAPSTERRGVFIFTTASSAEFCPDLREFSRRREGLRWRGPVLLSSLCSPSTIPLLLFSFPPSLLLLSYEKDSETLM